MRRFLQFLLSSVSIFYQNVTLLKSPMKYFGDRNFLVSIHLKIGIPPQTTIIDKVFTVHSALIKQLPTVSIHTSKDTQSTSTLLQCRM